MYVMHCLSRQETGKLMVRDVMQHTSLSNPSFMTHFRVDNAVVGRGNAGGQCQRVDVPAYAGTAHDGLLQKGVEEGLC